MAAKSIAERDYATAEDAADAGELEAYFAPQAQEAASQLDMARSGESAFPVAYIRGMLEQSIQTNLGIVRITAYGELAELIWGFNDGGSFTSEFPAHMMSHVARLKVNPNNRVVMHCHPANLLAMTYVHTLDERKFTRTLWQMCTECIVVFPEGVNVLPWMLCGTNEIGEATAEKMLTARLVVWAQHGIYGAGADLDETFGLIETAEKAAEIFMKIAHLPRVNTITDKQMHQLEQRFKITAREGYLD